MLDSSTVPDAPTAVHAASGAACACTETGCSQSSAMLATPQAIRPAALMVSPPRQSFPNEVFNCVIVVSSAKLPRLLEAFRSLLFCFETAEEFAFPDPNRGRLFS